MLYPEREGAMPKVCTHDLSEKETVCMDGMCPICFHQGIQEIKKKLDQLRQKNAKR